MGQTSKKPDNYNLEFIVSAGYLIFFCLALTFYFVYLAFINNPEKQHTPVNIFATSLPPTTPTPHISLVDQPDKVKLFEDDFTNNLHGWARKDDVRKEEVIGGKLNFESLIRGNYAFTGCKSCPQLKDPFFLQADFSTIKATDKSFGVMFNLDYDNDNFYVFQINAEARKYYFYHHMNDEWSLRAVGESSQIKSSPAVNTLGIYANQDIVEFYINGKIVDSYKESGYSFQKGDFSFYVGDSDFTLIVDNLTITTIRE